MVLTLVTMASATVMHAATNHLVDAVLALFLMVGGVVGRSSERGPDNGSAASDCASCSVSWFWRSEFGLGSISRCRRRICSRCGRWRRLMTWPASLILLVATVLVTGLAPPAAAERLITSLSEHRVMVTSSFNGSEVVLFGGIERDNRRVAAARQLRHRRYRYRPAPEHRYVRKERMLGIWSTMSHACSRTRLPILRC